MKRTFGAALAALVISGGFSAATAQNPIDHPDAQRRQVFKDADEKKADARARDRKNEDREEYRNRAPRTPRGTDIPVTLDEDIAITRENIGDRFAGRSRLETAA